MTKEIVIAARAGRTKIAIVEDGSLVELHLADADHKRTVGDIFLGRIDRVVASIPAAFVNIGKDQNAFLHFTDLDRNLPLLLAYSKKAAPNLRAHQPEIPPPTPGGKVAAIRRTEKAKVFKLLAKGQRILVQVTKEPISGKGMRVSARLSLAGRFLVLLPWANFVAISRKVKPQKERRRLRTLIRQLQPKGFGIIVRTVAKGKDRQALKKDLELLLKRWRQMEEKIAAVRKVPACVHTDVGMVASIMRDVFSSDYDRILVDDPRLHRNIQRYVHAVAPHLEHTVKLHTNKRPVFEATGLQKDVDIVFGKTVQVPSGGYLIFEQTEAMHVVDVNSGNARPAASVEAEQHALNINVAAARMVARQVRLRDLGGIIVVDFISMRGAQHRRLVFEALKEGFKADRTATSVHPMSDNCLIEITRQRTRPSLTAKGNEPSAGGAHPAASTTPEDLVASMEAWLQAQRRSTTGKLTVHVHPFTAAYLKRGACSLWLQWQVRYKVRIQLKESTKVGIMAFQFAWSGTQPKPKPKAAAQPLRHVLRSKASAT